MANIFQFIDKSDSFVEDLVCANQQPAPGSMELLGAGWPRPMASTQDALLLASLEMNRPKPPASFSKTPRITGAQLLRRQKDNSTID